MAVESTVVVLGEPAAATTCRTCGEPALIHTVHRLTSDGVETIGQVAICDGCGGQSRI